MTTPPTLLLLTGPPGTGKSSLADAAAGALGAPVLGWDWVMAGLTDFDGIQQALRTLPAAEHRLVGWSMLWNIATAQLRRGCSVVLDGVARDEHVAGTRRLARDEGATALVVVTSCSDPGLHRQRIEGRARLIPGWHELDWEHVARVVAGFTAPADADLHLDAVAPFAENRERLAALLAPPS